MTDFISANDTMEEKAEIPAIKNVPVNHSRNRAVKAANSWGLKALRPGDFILAALLLTSAIVWIVIGVGPISAGSTALVQVGGNQVAQIVLGRENYITVQGALGPVLIGVDASGIRILNSRCPNKLCMRMDAINHAGDWIACVPNKLVIRIEGESGVDAISPGSAMP